MTENTKFSMPSLISKLLRMLEDQDSVGIIGWTSSQDGFIIENVNIFTEKVLANFIRQLNMYGFSKCKAGESGSIFQHPNFRRGCRTSLKKIQRKTTSYQDKTQASSMNQGNLREQAVDPLKNITQIRQRQLMLQQKFKQMLKNNKKVFNSNISIISNVKREDKNQQKIVSNIFKMLKMKTGNIPNSTSIQNQSLSSRIRKQNSYDDDRMSERSSYDDQIKSCIRLIDNRAKTQSTSLDESFYNQLQNFIELNQFQEVDEFGQPGQQC